MGFPGGSDGEESACKAGDLGSQVSLQERYLGGGHGNPLQYSCLENLHGQRSLVGYSPCGHKESDMTEQLSTVSTAYIKKSRFELLYLGLFQLKQLQPGHIYVMHP